MSWRIQMGLGLALLAPGCGEAPEPQALGAPVTLQPVQAVDLVERIEATGELLALEHAEVAAEVAGRISEVLRYEGSAVEVGAAVLAIDPERRTLERNSALARVDEASARLVDAEADHRRMRDLHRRKVASDEQLDQAETELKLARSRMLAAEADLGVLDRALRDATVVAPFSGFIARRHVSRGEYVQQGDVLFELVALDPIEVEFQLPELDSGRVAVGQQVDVRLGPFPDEIFEATVSFVSPTIDSRTRTLRVKAQLANDDGRLRPGLFARVDLGISERPGVAMVPEEAILQRAEGPVVFRADAENRVERVRIETGVHREGWVEVVAGLVPGELIVSRGQAWLSDGQLVVPRRPDGTLATRSLPSVAEGSPERPDNIP